MEFTVSGSGAIPRDAQGGQGGGQAAGQAADQSAGAPATPGGGIGTPIDTPDPLSKYKWWILGGLALLLAAAAAFLLRKPEGSGGRRAGNGGSAGRCSAASVTSARLCASRNPRRKERSAAQCIEGRAVLPRKREALRHHLASRVRRSQSRTGDRAEAGVEEKLASCL